MLRRGFARAAQLLSSTATQHSYLEACTDSSLHSLPFHNGILSPMQQCRLLLPVASLHSHTQGLSSLANFTSRHNVALGVAQTQQCRHKGSWASINQYSKEDIRQIRSRIFGDFVNPGGPRARTGRKYLARKLIGDKVASYYPEKLASKKNDPLYFLYKDSKKVEKRFLRARRGKVAPKKGEGKRSGKKKR